MKIEHEFWGYIMIIGINVCPNSSKKFTVTDKLNQKRLSKIVWKNLFGYGS